MFDEKIKVQWQFGDFVAAPLSLHLGHAWGGW
jgi:hypothetical protein